MRVGADGDGNVIYTDFVKMFYPLWTPYVYGPTS